MNVLKRITAGGRRRRICIAVAVAATLVAIALVFVVLGFTVFRPRHAIATINSFFLGVVQAGNSSFGIGVDVNATLLVDLSVTNPNRASFSYPRGGTAELFYRGNVAGVAAIPPGAIGARETLRMNVTLTVLAGRFIADSNVYSDILSGSLAVNTFTRIAGKVTVLGLLKLRTVAYTTCDVVVNVTSRSISSTSCKYRTKV
ncbi:unnamed protein product [Spirodela intermedia]|uniref:Late embryogenesis abundant protein LEA-2 subgroup domain-containing protein n=2 Tax=Spirodela intermedia TaxID=51605 RepID=A0A7I8L7Z0_SPIIN|nr:unnamed protein product [Spirodela intermedia]CAA6669215.1 unnamed protein product [Spirodela intermedia]CAA7406161.1 unnamed protein product [Spirodela intermedia]